jgi:dTDP-4-dehydrorhamnose reductase
MSKKTIVVTGSNGFIGSKIIEALVQFADYTVIGWSKGDNRLLGFSFSYANINLTNSIEVERNFNEVKPDVLIHCAAISQVDVCEQKPEVCHALNVAVTTQLVNLSHKIGTRIIYFSSDFVFDGKKEWLHEDDVPKSISKYGQSKRLAELVVEQSVNWAIIRPVLVYGYSKSASRGNIFTWVLNSVKTQKSINVVNDQFRTPTYVGDVVGLVKSLIGSTKVGRFHIGGADRVSIYEFAIKISELVGCESPMIQEVSSSTVKGANLRPINSCVDNSKVKNIFGLKPIGILAGIEKSIKQII